MWDGGTTYPWENSQILKEIWTPSFGIKIFYSTFSVPLYVPLIKTCHLSSYLIKFSHYAFSWLITQNKLRNQTHHYHQPWLALATSALNVTYHDSHNRLIYTTTGDPSHSHQPPSLDHQKKPTNLSYFSSFFNIY